MNRTEVSFNGKGLDSLSIDELYQFQSETIESCIIHGDNLKHDEMVCNTWNCKSYICVIKKNILKSNIKKDENKLALIAKEIDNKYQTTLMREC